jgi:hypothetical protein
MDGVVMKIAMLIILAVLGYFVWSWWQNRNVDKMEVGSGPVAPPVPQDPVPQEPGIIMYGNDSCPWCTKQKEYFKSKNIEYTFIDCNSGTGCPNFVHGFPTIVKDGVVMPGYQEL